jgi:hypothetical protein
MDSLSHLESLTDIPKAREFPIGHTIEHPFWEISANPRQVVLKLTRAERRMYMETWELESAVYLPTQQKVGLDEKRARKIEEVTRGNLEDQVTQNSPVSVTRQGNAEGIGAVRATYRKRTSPLVVPVWLDEQGRVRS